MSLSSDISDSVDAIIAGRWNTRDGRVVPESDDISFLADAVALDATFLYADLAASTTLARDLKRHLAAEVFQAYLSSASRVIRAKGGEIRSFDGDRVLAVFIGSYKNSSAVDCALKISYVVNKVLQPKFSDAYEAIGGGTYTFRHGVGVDTGKVWAVRGGVRNNSDLVFVGPSASIAAKLSGLRENDASHIYITSRVFESMDDKAKYAQAGDRKGELMWESRNWTGLPNETIYRSSWYRPI